MNKKTIIAIVILILSISITILLCSILKNIKDPSGITISKNDISVQAENVNIKDIKDEMFMPLFFKNDLVTGKLQSTLTEYNIDEFEKSYPCDGSKANLYSISEKNKAIKTSLIASDGITSIGSKNKFVRQSKDGKISYINYDKSENEIVLDNYIEPIQDNITNCTISFLDGNDNYLVTYITDICENNSTIIKIYDINEKKLYSSDNLEHPIYNTFFIKYMDSIMAMDTSGQLYKIILSDNKVNIEKKQKLSINSLENTIGFNSIKVINDTEILILNRNTDPTINNIITKYNFKTRKTTPLLKTNKTDASVWVTDINADGSLIVLEKGINNINKGLLLNEMYFAKVSRDSLDVFYNTTMENNTFNYYSLSDNGKSIFITTTSWNSKNNNSYSYKKYTIK